MDQKTAEKKLEKILDLYDADTSAIIETMTSLGLQVVGIGHDCPEVTIDQVEDRPYKQACVVKVGDNIVFDGVSRDILLTARIGEDVPIV